jgi:flagellum-specific peptidoglycan hydrolase FlgJ
MPLTPQQTTNLHLIAEAAIASELTTTIPAELTCAQCILESAWLKVAPGNNCFGIKNYHGSYGRQLLLTREWFTDHERDYFLGLGDGRKVDGLVDPSAPPNAVGRKQYRVYDWFATFPTLATCFARRASMFLNTRYAVFQSAYLADHNFDAYLRGIARIYATDPSYADKLLALIRMPEVQDALYEAKENLNKMKA